jgi:hypothetical protein
MVAARRGRAAFFAPLTLMLPWSGRPPLIRILSIACLGNYSVMGWEQLLMIFGRMSILRQTDFRLSSQDNR